MRVSVIMPTYNQCGFIRRALLSLTKQTYTDWELILVNDGCTDETEAFIADYLEDGRKQPTKKMPIHPVSTNQPKKDL